MRSFPRGVSLIQKKKKIFDNSYFKMLTLLIGLKDWVLV